METLIRIIAELLVLAYGCFSLWLVFRQRRVSHALLVGGGLLLCGAILYQFLFIVAGFVTWILIIALALYILGALFG